MEQFQLQYNLIDLELYQAFCAVEKSGIHSPVQFPVSVLSIAVLKPFLESAALCTKIVTVAIEVMLALRYRDFYNAVNG